MGNVLKRFNRRTALGAYHRLTQNRLSGTGLSVPHTRNAVSIRFSIDDVHIALSLTAHRERREVLIAAQYQLDHKPDQPNAE